MLESLPTEVILIIIDELKPKDVLSAAKVCRRLNLIALPYFLFEMGLHNPATSCIVKASSRRYTDELAALSIHFSLTAIDRFFCIISHRRDLEETFIPPSHISWLTLNITRDNSMLLRLSSVGSFSLVIDSWGSGWSLRSDVVRKFIASVLELTETAIRKSCQSLQILHFHPTTAERIYNFELVERDQTPRFLKTIKSLMTRMSYYRRPNERPLVGNGWKYDRPSDLKFIQPQKPRLSQSQLTHIDLDSGFLLIPPFSVWTFNVMKNSPIVSLMISLPSSITKDEFHHYTFPEIARSLPHLQEIKCAFHESTFLKIVIEHLHLLPQLRKITFGLSFWDELPTPLPSLTTQIHLGFLTSFTGSPDQAAYFFNGTYNNNRTLPFCPNLKQINLISDTYYQHQTYQTDYISIAESFCSINKRMSEMRIAPSISLCLANQGEVPQGVHISDVDSVGMRHWAEHFLTVTHLTLEIYPPPLHDELHPEKLHQILVDRALAWLNIFRGVRYLTLTVKRDDTDGLEPSQSQLLAAINAVHPELLMTNVVFLSIDPKKYHYHWSNARDDWERGTDDIPTTPSYDKKSRDFYTCSHF